MFRSTENVCNVLNFQCYVKLQVFCKLRKSANKSLVHHNNYDVKVIRYLKTLRSKTTFYFRPSIFYTTETGSVYATALDLFMSQLKCALNLHIICIKKVLVRH